MPFGRIRVISLTLNGVRTMIPNPFPHANSSSPADCTHQQTYELRYVNVWYLLACLEGPLNNSKPDVLASDEDAFADSFKESCVFQYPE